MRFEHQATSENIHFVTALEDHSWMASAYPLGIEEHWPYYFHSFSHLAGDNWCELNRIRQPSVVKVAPLYPDEHEKRFKDELLAAFDSEVLESGVRHPADAIIKERLDSGLKEWILHCLRSLSLNESEPSFASSVLRCLGRQPVPATVEWRQELVGTALESDNLEIRDAAVQAADSWSDSSLIDVLSRHDEPEEWLRDFIEETIESLTSEEDVSGT